MTEKVSSDEVSEIIKRVVSKSPIKGGIWESVVVRDIVFQLSRAKIDFFRNPSIPDVPRRRRSDRLLDTSDYQI